MMRRIAFAFVLMLAPHLFAAVTTSALSGRVTSGGAPAAGVTVTATSHALIKERATITGSSGTYWLAALPPGEYEVTFSRAGLQTLTRRVVVQLGRIARADAKLEPSEDEEHVTSTQTTISVVHDTALSTNRSSQTLDRMPYPVTTSVPFFLAPGVAISFVIPDVDEAIARVGDDAVQSETIDEITLFRGITPIEHARTGETPIVARTRAGGEELSVSVRDTFAHRASRNHLESASGGRIVPERLWFFAAGWDGDESDGFELKLTGALDAKQTLTATVIDHEQRGSFGTQDVTIASLVHVAQWNSRLLSETTVSREDVGDDQTTLSAKASYVLDRHVLSGGIAIENGAFGDARSLFLSDRIWLQRLVLNAGIRVQDEAALSGYNPGGPQIPLRGEEHFSAQVAALYDPLGRGRNAISASASRYVTFAFDHVDELTAGYIIALGSTGSARLDVIHRGYESAPDVLAVQLDSVYRLFDRFEAGLNYTWSDADTASPFLILPRRRGNAWFSAEFPLGAHAVGGTVAYRTIDFAGSAIENFHAIDLGLRYTLPVARAALTLAADAQNLTNSGSDFFTPRIMRGWIRLRL